MKLLKCPWVGSKKNNAFLFIDIIQICVPVVTITKYFSLKTFTWLKVTKEISMHSLNRVQEESVPLIRFSSLLF